MTAALVCKGKEFCFTSFQDDVIGIFFRPIILDALVRAFKRMTSLNAHRDEW